MLLAGETPVVVSNLFGIAEMPDFSLRCDHLEAIEGYVDTGYEKSAPVVIKREGKADETLTVTGNDEIFSGIAGTPFARGESFSVELTVDPAKPQFVQGKVSATGVAE